jgi:hypothetical protein
MPILERTSGRITFHNPALYRLYQWGSFRLFFCICIIFLSVLGYAGKDVPIRNKEGITFIIYTFMLLLNTHLGDSIPATNTIPRKCVMHIILNIQHKTNSCKPG